MTFFGQDGTKTGFLSNFLLFAFLIYLNPLPAFGAGFGGESTAATYSGTASSVFAMPQSGFTTPSTVFRPLPGTSGAVFPGRLNIRATDSNSYRIRNDLSMEVTRTYTVTLWPQFKNEGATLSDGWYLLRFVVVLPNEKYYARRLYGKDIHMTEEERYVTSKKVLGYYSRTRNGGAIEVTFDMVLPDITRGMIRSKLYVKMSPITQTSCSATTPKDCIATINGDVDPFNTFIVHEVQSNLIPLVSIAQFVPMRDSNDPPVKVPDGRSIDPIAADLDGYVKRAEKNLPNLDFNLPIDEVEYATNPKLGNLLMMDAYSPELVNSLNWHRYDMPSVPKYLNQQVLADLIPLAHSYTQEIPNRMDLSVSRALCSQLARMQGIAFSSIQSWILKCSSYPHYYMSIHKNVHVRAMDSYGSSAQAQDAFPFQLISNKSLNNSSSTDLSFSVGLNPSSVFPLSGFGEALKLSPISVSGNAGQGVSDSIVDSGISQSFKSFKVKQFVAEIPIQRYRACVAFEIDEHFFPGKIKTRGIYICDQEKVEKLVFNESYYFAMQDTLGEDDVTPQALNLLFRGDRDVNTFLAIAGEQVQTIKRNQLKIGVSFQNAAYVYSRMPGAIPGIISLPMVQKEKITYGQDPGEVKKPTWYESVLNFYK